MDRPFWRSLRTESTVRAPQYIPEPSYTYSNTRARAHPPRQLVSQSVYLTHVLRSLSLKVNPCLAAREHHGVLRIGVELGSS